MYTLKVEHSFDSAHFLAGYKGKCGNIHGHRWKIEVEIQSEALVKGGQIDGMIMDFTDIKEDVKNLLDFYDHALIIEEGTMRGETLTLLEEDGFRIIKVPFRPTAENFAAFFFKALKEKSYNIKRVTVYETPSNCATYEEGGSY